MWAGVALLLGFVALLAFWASMVVLLQRHRTARALAMLTAWAEEHGYCLLDCEPRLLAVGPFDMFHTPLRIVFRFSAADKFGRRRTGWACCGRRFLGLLDGRVAVRWDSVPAGELHVERRLRRNRKGRVCDHELDASMDVTSYSDGRKADQRGKIGR
jgi:hypothetical protein